MALRDWFTSQKKRDELTLAAAMRQVRDSLTWPKSGSPIVDVSQQEFNDAWDSADCHQRNRVVMPDYNTVVYPDKILRCHKAT